jgi:hypothetical protein
VRLPPADPCRGRQPVARRPPRRLLLLALPALALLAGCGSPAPPAAPTAAPSAVAEAHPSLRAVSVRPELAGLELVVRGGSFAAGRLELVVAVENRGTQRVRSHELSGRDLRLVSPDGADNAPLEVGAELDPLTTYDGLAPKTFNEGPVVFLLPRGAGHHRLRLDGFAPVELDLAWLPPKPVAKDAGAAEKPAALAARAQLEHLLLEQSLALRERDMGRYLATLAPELRRREGGLAAQLRAADVGGVDLRLLAEPLVPAPGTPGGFDAPVELTYWLTDLPDDNPFVHRLVYRVTEVDGRWLVYSTVAAPGDRMPFWCEPGVQRLPSTHFVVFSRVGTAQQLNAVAFEAETAYERMRHLRLPLEQRYAVHVLPADEFARLLGSSVVGAALAHYSLEEGTIRVDNQAFYITGALFDEQGPLRFTQRAREETVTHELVHLALIGRTRPTTPVWLVEGAAVYFSGGLGPDTARRLARRLSSSLSLVWLSGTDSLLGHGLGSAEDQYDYAGLAVAHIIETRGMEAFSRLYSSFSKLPPDRAMEARLDEGGLTRGLVAFPGAAAQRAQADELVQQTLGVGLDELDVGLKRWIVEEAKRP